MVLLPLLRCIPTVLSSPLSPAPLAEKVGVLVTAESLAMAGAVLHGTVGVEVGSREADVRGHLRQDARQVVHHLGRIDYQDLCCPPPPSPPEIDADKRKTQRTNMKEASVVVVVVRGEETNTTGILKKESEQKRGGVVVVRTM